MSAEATVWAWNQTGINPNAKLLLLRVVDQTPYGDERDRRGRVQMTAGRFNADRADLMRATGMGEEDLLAAIADLAAAGLMEWSA